MEPVFCPPLHAQRHQFVVDFVRRNKPRRVLDLGCGECSLLRKLKFLRREVDVLAGLDLDGAKIGKKMRRLAPIPTDYLQPGYDQLCVELYQGSVTQRDARLRGFDLVAAIELIEHLALADVEPFSEVVFGYMAPAAAIVSTPNSEFNPLFPGLTGFRHSDHKFEWTRAEFQTWALKVCSEFGYEVEFTGVGRAPPGQQESFGFCSQIGVFHRLGGRDGRSAPPGDGDVFSHTLLYRISYPSLHDNNILRRVVASEVLSWIDELKKGWLERRAEREEDDAVRQGGRCLPEAGGEYEELLRTSDQEQRGSCTSCRRLSVPLDVLWSRCPRVRELSGSPSDLRHLLTGDPQVRLSQDGCTVMIECDEEEDQKGEDAGELEDSGFAEARCFSGNAVEEEDWEAEV